FEDHPMVCSPRHPQAGSPARYGGSPSIATVGRHAPERWVVMTQCAHLDANTCRKSAIFRIIKEPPVVRWGVMVGEVFHNLRSALDHTITDLTIAEGGQPLAGTEFPIFEDEAKYSELAKDGTPTRRSGLYKIRGVSDQAKAIIYGLQPFDV